MGYDTGGPSSSSSNPISIAREMTVATIINHEVVLLSQERERETASFFASARETLILASCGALARERESNGECKQPLNFLHF